MADLYFWIGAVQNKKIKQKMTDGDTKGHEIKSATKSMNKRLFYFRGLQY